MQARPFSFVSFCLTTLIFGTICGVIFGAIGCKAFESPSQTSRLSMIADDRYELFLTYSEKGYYQFLTCDTKARQARPEVSSSQIPEYCVSSFVSMPRKISCQSYYQLRPMCAVQSEAKQHCEKGSPMPENLQGFDCETLPLLESSCAVSLPLMEPGCRQWYDTTQQCLESQGEDRQSCQAFRELDKTSYPFVLKDPSLNHAQKVQLDWFLNHQITQQKERGRPLRMFGSGAALAVLTREAGRQIIKPIPNVSGWKNSFVMLGSMKVRLRNFAAFFAQIGLINSVTEDQPQFFTQLMYSPQAMCISESGQLLKPRKDGELVDYQKTIPLESTEDISRLFRDGVLYGSLGFTSNMVVLRLSRGAHPVVRIGSLLVVPFVSMQLGKGKSTSAEEVSKHFDAIMASSEEQTSVPSIEDILPVLGKSLVLASKAPLVHLHQFCVPRKTPSGSSPSGSSPSGSSPSGSYEPYCAPVFTKSDGVLYDLVHNEYDRTKGACDAVIRDLFREGL